MLSKKIFPCNSREVVIIVKTYQNGIMDGCLYHVRLGQKEEFHSLSQMVLFLDRLLDLEDCPNRPLALSHAICDEGEGIAVFRIQVLFREHYTWQGRLVWQDENREVVFRSTLELIQVLDEILAT